MILILLLTATLEFTGCTSPAGGGRKNGGPPEADTVSAATGGWSIRVTGFHDQAVDQGYFEEAQMHRSHYVDREFTRRGETRTYSGMPLRLVIAMVDGEDREHPYRFDEALWQEGYDVTLIARSGYSITFSTAELSPDELIIADRVDGTKVPPRIVGDVPGTFWIEELIAVETDLALGGEIEEFVLDIRVDGTVKEFTLGELEASPYFTENTGSFTTSAGTRYTHTYGGVSLVDFLSSFVQIEEDTTLVFTASDGYEMSFRGEQFLDSTGGTWILAFRRDGEYLPLDPGYIRTVKVGPGDPNIDGHLSVKMVEEITISGEKFEDFGLIFRGRADVMS
jgi:hypothetical protein